MASAAVEKNLREGRIMRLARWLGQKTWLRAKRPDPYPARRNTELGVIQAVGAFFASDTPLPHLSLPADHRPEVCPAVARGACCQPTRTFSRAAQATC